MQEELTYEQAMKRIEQLASQLEDNQIGIDEMAEKLKEAQQLIAYCKQKLYTADEEIQKILAKE